MKSATRRHYGAHPSRAVIRATWREVTRTPLASVRDMAARIHYTHSSVAVALRILADAGYIEQSFNAKRARRVLVPFVEVRV